MKVKLKAGKKIPKHLNELKPEFKAKKIQVKLLQDVQSNPIKLLANFNLSTNLKLVYLNKLKDSLSQNNNSTHTGEQIQTVCKYLTDVDQKVRTEAINCLKKCLEMQIQDSNAIKPIFNIILTFVNCGITHINPQIRSDAQKFLFFIVDKSDKHLNNQLMQMFLTRIKSFNLQQIDAEFYSILEKLVKKIGQVKECSEHREKENCDEGLVIRWSPANNVISFKLNNSNRFDNFQDLSLTFRNQFKVDIEEEFETAVGNHIISEIKHLVGKGERAIPISEAPKALSVLRIALDLKIQDKVLQFWSNNQAPVPRCIPTLSVVSTDTSKLAKNKNEGKQVAALQSQINQQLNRYKKFIS